MDNQTLVLDLSIFIPEFMLRLSHITEKDPYEVLQSEPKGIYSNTKLKPICLPTDVLFNQRTGERIEKVEFGMKDNIVDETGQVLIHNYQLNKNANLISNYPFYSYNVIMILRKLVDILVQDKLIYGQRNVEPGDFKSLFKEYIKPKYLKLLLDDVGIYSCVRELENQINAFIDKPIWNLVDIKYHNFQCAIVLGEDYRIKDWTDKVNDGTISDEVANKIYSPLIEGPKSTYLGDHAVAFISNYKPSMESTYKLKSSTGKATRNKTAIYLDTTKAGKHVVQLDKTRFEYFVFVPKAGVVVI